MSEVSIDTLHDDCLLQILELLTLKERVKVELVCKRWQKLCRQLWKYTQKIVIGRDRPKYYSFGLRCKKPILEPLLMLCGTNLRSLTISYGCENNIFKLISRYCDSLNSLTLEGCDVTRNPVFENSCTKLNSLKEIKLHCGNITGKQLENIFTSQPNIKCLELEFIKTLNKSNFDKLNEEVESISLSNCDNIDNDYIIKKVNNFKYLKRLYINTGKMLRLNELIKAIPQIEHLKIQCFLYIGEELREIKVLKNLRSLSLNLVDSITDNTMAAIVENCRLLENLCFGYSISRCPVTSKGLKRLAELPKLSKIYMKGVQQINDEVLEMLAINEKLTHVDVSYCDNVRDRSIIAILKQCPYLQELDITHCEITTEILWWAVKVAEERPLTPPLYIYNKSKQDFRIQFFRYKNICLKIIGPDENLLMSVKPFESSR